MDGSLHGWVITVIPRRSYTRDCLQESMVTRVLITRVRCYVCVCSVASVVSNSATLWNVPLQVPLFIEFSRQEY